MNVIKKKMFATLFTYLLCKFSHEYFCSKLWLKLNFASVREFWLSLAGHQWTSAKENFCNNNEDNKLFVDPYTVGQKSECAYCAMAMQPMPIIVQNTKIIFGNSCAQNMKTYIFVFSWCCWTRQNILLHNNLKHFREFNLNAILNADAHKNEMFPFLVFFNIQDLV